MKQWLSIAGIVLVGILFLVIGNFYEKIVGAGLLVIAASGAAIEVLPERVPTGWTRRMSYVKTIKDPRG